MLRAYFDESGIHEGAKICCLGGYMASEDTWNSFEPEWADIMQSFGVMRFHATDCNSSRGEFEGWDSNKKRDFMDRVVGCLAREGMLAIGSSVVLEDYDAVVPEELKRRIADPYYLCMEHCVQSAVRRMREFWPAGERVVIVFDRQDVYRGRAALRFEHYLKGRRYGPHIAGMGYVNSADADLSGPLGAADLVAFETAKHLHNRRYDHDRAPRVVFDRLWRESSVDAKYWDREAFEGLIEMIAHVKPSDDPLP